MSEYFEYMIIDTDLAWKLTSWKAVSKLFSTLPSCCFFTAEVLVSLGLYLDNEVQFVIIAGKDRQTADGKATSSCISFRELECRSELLCKNRKDDHNFIEMGPRKWK